MPPENKETHHKGTVVSASPSEMQNYSIHILRAVTSHTFSLVPVELSKPSWGNYWIQIDLPQFPAICYIQVGLLVAWG